MTTVPQTQKVLYLSSLGGDFVVGTRHVDVPGRGEILVKVHSVGLNPGDWKTQRFEHAGKMVDAYPWVGGWDGSGEVVAVGDDSEGGFERGDKVLFQNAAFKTRFGTYQQFVIVNTGVVAKIPSNLSYDEAATIPLVLATAYGGLYHSKPWGFGLNVPTSELSHALERNSNTKVNSEDVDVTGEPIVVIGGASGVGQMFIQLATLSGFSPIITTASSKHTEYLTSLGAAHVLDRKLSNEEIKSKVNEITAGKRVRYAYDAIGADETRELGLHVLDASPSESRASDGDSTTLAQLGTVDPSLATPLNELRPDGKRLNASIAILNEGEGFPDNAAMFKELYKRLGGWVESGVVKPTRFEVVPNGLGGVTEGIARLERDEVSGFKLVGHPQETD